MRAWIKPRLTSSGQRSTVSDQVMARPPRGSVAASQQFLPSAGDALDTHTRSKLEPRFGYDFSRVRIHNGPEAAGYARDIHASAFTIGQNIVFDQGRYRPHTVRGLRLLAHELAHVVQQSHVDRPASV